MPRRQVESRTEIPYNVKYHVWDECGRICAHCGKPVVIGGSFSLEHVIPLHKGGKNDRSNYVSLCKECNKAKSDNVVEPLDYYPYLPKKRKAELKELFEEYIHSTNWLEKDNVFPVDCFDITVYCPVVKINSGRVMFMPTTMRVEKTDADDAFEYLFAYTGRLRTQDKELMASSPEGLNTPYYRLEHKGKTVMYFTAYIDKPNWANGHGDEKNAVQIRIFSNPEIKDRHRETDATIASIVRAIITEIQTSLMNTQRSSVIECQVMTPYSDNFSRRGLVALSTFIQGRCSSIEMSSNIDDPNAGKAVGLNLALFNGTYADLMKLTEEEGHRSPKELYDKFQSGDRQEDIEKELEQSREFRQIKEKPHKNSTKKYQKSAHKETKKQYVPKRKKKYPKKKRK